MGLMDWDVILGTGVFIDNYVDPETGKHYFLSGSGALGIKLDSGVCFLVHRATYQDKPKNVKVETWFNPWVHGVGGYEPFHYHFMIGAIARKQEGADTFFYWYADITIESTNKIVGARFIAGYYINGNNTQLINESIMPAVVGKLSYYYNYYWTYWQMSGYEISGKFRMEMRLSSQYDSPDPLNPPYGDLELIALYDADIPAELQNGGAVGFIVGHLIDNGNYVASPRWDRTLLFY